MKDVRSNESCRRVSISPSPPEQDLLVGDQATQPHRVHRDAGDPAAPRALGVLGGGIGDVAEAGVRPGRAMSSAVRAAVPEARRPCSGGAAR